jgi:hypothetical protein
MDTFHLFDLALLRFVCMTARASRGPMASRGQVLLYWGIGASPPEGCN